MSSILLDSSIQVPKNPFYFCFVFLSYVVSLHYYEFKLELSNKDTISEIGKVLEIMPGHVIHCALIVLNGDDVRFTAEEQVMSCPISK